MSFYEMMQGVINDPVGAYGMGLLGGGSRGRGSFDQGLLNAQSVQNQVMKRQHAAAQAERTAEQYAALQNWAASNPAGLMGLQPQQEQAMQGLINANPAYANKSIWDRHAQKPTAAPSSVREWMYFNSLPEPEQKRYLEMKRSPQWLNQGMMHTDPNTGRQYPINYIQPAVDKASGGEVVAQSTGAPQKLRTLRTTIDDFDRTVLSLKDLAGMTDWTTTGFGTFLSGIPYTDANAWKTLKSTIVANIGLNKLSQLKAQTATGASGMGALSERELQLLIDEIQSLEQATKPSEMKKRIEKVIYHYGRLRGYAIDDWKSVNDNYQRTQPLMPEALQREMPAPPEESTYDPGAETGLDATKKKWGLPE